MCKQRRLLFFLFERISNEKKNCAEKNKREKMRMKPYVCFVTRDFALSRCVKREREREI